MSDVRTPDQTLGKPCSVEEIRQLHLVLLREWNDLGDKEKCERADVFRREAAQAGAYIKNPEDRDTVQGIIDYWSATMASLPTVGTYPEAVLLADFNTATVQKQHGTCPFVGLNPFGTGDAPYYFGREKDVQALIAILDANLMAVIAGPSGTGKTSLAQAGVAGHLLGDAGKRALIGTIRPGRDPIGALLGTVRPSNAGADWIDAERTALAKTPDRFRELAEARLGPEQAGLLIIDRAEELFASDVASTDILLAANVIAALVAGAGKKHRVLLTIREDFFDQLSALVKPTGNDLPEGAVRRLGPLGPDNLRDAIIKPGEKEGFAFDEPVVADIVQDIVAQPDALPLLEFALTQLWKLAEVDRVSWSDYQKLPKPSQLLTDVAERVYASLPSHNAEEVARIALLEMIRVGQDVTGRRVRRDDLHKVLRDQSVSDADLNEVLRRFVDSGLVRRIPAETIGDERFELSHSAVIRHWPRLIVWLQEKRRAEAGRERYVAALERWRANGKASRYLLSLAALRDSGRYRGFNGALDEYIAASRRWWLHIGLALLGSIALVVFLFACQSLRFGKTFDRLTRQHLNAESAARDESVAGADFSRQAMIADQTLLRAIESGTLPRSAVPAEFLARLAQTPSTLPRHVDGYDPQFLDPSSEARVPLPRFAVDPGRVVTVNYPHTTVIYDLTRKIPLVVASNRAADGTMLAPFNGVGYFPDPRIPAQWQSRDRVSPDPNLGRVPLVEWQQVAWAPAGTKAGDASFLNYMPLSVLQRWTFYDGLWSSIDQRLLALDVNRLTVLTGPILNGSEPIVNGTVVPQAYWKVAVHWDPAAGALSLEAYRAEVGAKPDTPAAQATTTLEAISRATGLDFGRSETPVAQAAAPKADTSTVYLQFAAMPRRDALEISRRLADFGYKVPPEERLESAAGLAEVRYVNPEDKDQAVILAQRTGEILSSLGYGSVTVQVHALPWVKNKPPRGILELWLGLTPPRAAMAD